MINERKNERKNYEIPSHVIDSILSLDSIILSLMSNRILYRIKFNDKKNEHRGLGALALEGERNIRFLENNIYGLDSDKQIELLRKYDIKFTLV